MSKDSHWARRRLVNQAVAALQQKYQENEAWDPRSFPEFTSDFINAVFHPQGERSET